jgi:sensor c-di-GMP phosphodiesterase-like protein
MRINTMTKERKTSILALIIICIACLLAGCATKNKAMTETATEQETTKVEQVKDTAITETYDTTRITQKLVPVEIAVPEAKLERTTKDTTSVLETDLYRSTATWANGVLTHTLEAKPGAKLKGQATATDTTKISKKSSSTKNSRNSSTDSRNSQKDTQQTTKTTQASWDIWLGAGIIICIGATIAIIWIWRKRKKPKN